MRNEDVDPAGFALSLNEALQTFGFVMGPGPNALTIGLRAHRRACPCFPGLDHLPIDGDGFPNSGSPALSEQIAIGAYVASIELLQLGNGTLHDGPLEQSGELLDLLLRARAKDEVLYSDLRERLRRDYGPCLSGLAESLHGLLKTRDKDAARALALRLGMLPAMIGSMRVDVQHEFHLEAARLELI